jgi:hypothetical protein
MRLIAHCNASLGRLLQLVQRHIFEPRTDSHAWQGPTPRKFPSWSHLGLGCSPSGAVAKVGVI